ncbi:MAG: cytochrome c-type biogenesis protein CcmH [Candidatus Dadabacteria bacterium]|nr:cytochrome c-type biogenesis protein CcmH [Candidatus Dadabacteria bacterium]
MTIGISVLLAFLFLCVPSFAQTSTNREDTIAKQLMCRVCAGQSVAESDSQLARDIRGEIKRQIKEGKSDEEIILTLRKSFGDGILAEPPFRGFNVIVWLLPFIAALTGAAFAADYIRRNMRS